MTLTQDDMQLFKDLRMTEFGRVIQEIIDDPARDHDSFEDKIQQALYAQRDARDNRRIEKLLKAAGLAYTGAALERFDTTTDRGITTDRINRLASCDWIHHGQDLMVIGATGTGKSFLAQALGVTACRAQFPTRYVRLATLADDFDALAINPTARKEFMAELARPSLLILDDFLTTTISDHALLQVFNLLVTRENASTVIASQHQPDYWYSVFNDSAIADAVLSRLANNGLLLRLKGDDMRTRDDLNADHPIPNTTIPRHLRRN